LGLNLQEKQAVVAEVNAQVANAQTIVLAEYRGIAVSDITKLRASARGAGVYLHVLKNTLAKRALEAAGYSVPDGMLAKSTAVSFAFSDVASTAKALADATKGMEFAKVKGGFIGGKAIAANQVKSLADLPTLPVARARLLGMLQAPAGKLVRTIAEPARSLAAVFKAYADKPAAA
jgi:large subunit ribosomal protein L10